MTTKRTSITPGELDRLTDTTGIDWWHWDWEKLPPDVDRYLRMAAYSCMGGYVPHEFKVVFQEYPEAWGR